MQKVRVGITSGDINGVGLEVVIKTLADSRMTDLCTPVIYGSAKVLSYHKNIVKPEEFSYQSLSTAEHLRHDKISVINCWTDDIVIALGEPNEDSGKFAYVALDKAVQDLENGLIDVLVTAPIDKQAMSVAGFKYNGHTEYLTDRFGSGESLMMMVAEKLRVAIATNHIPISEVAQTLNKELIQHKLVIFNRSLKRDFGIERPLLAVLGLNPHAGDKGLIGKEEEVFIRPAIEDLRKKGIMIGGPYSADGFFGSEQYKKVDGILAMYHDQGLVPFKALSFGSGINFTAGLSVIRTSPDHGTAVNIAGQNQANPKSFREALFLAVDLFKNRGRYRKDHQDPLHKKNLHEGAEDEIISEDIVGDR